MDCHSLFERLYIISLFRRDIWDDYFRLEFSIWIRVLLCKEELIVNQRLEAFRNIFIFIFTFFDFSASIIEMFNFYERLWRSIDLIVPTIIITS